MPEWIEIENRSYNVNALKRQKCRVCGESNYPNLETYYYRITAEKVGTIADVEDYAEIFDPFAYICYRCLIELLHEYPMAVTEIRRVFP